MRILSIDPGYERLGVAIVEKTKGQKEVLVFSDCIRTDAKEAFEDRLTTLGLKIESLIEEYKPEALSIENLFISNNQKQRCVWRKFEEHSFIYVEKINFP